MFKSILDLLFVFFGGCVLGWVVEVFFRRFISNPQKKWINPGLLTGPYLPIYGFGVIFLHVLTKLFSEKVDFLSEVIFIIVLFIVSGVVMTLLELITGTFFLNHYNLRLWDYRDNKFNYKGLICPLYSCIWGALSVIYFYFLDPAITYAVEVFRDHLWFSFFVGLICGFFIIDLVKTFNLIDKIKQFNKEKQVVINYDFFKQELQKAQSKLDNKVHFFVNTNKEKIKEFLDEKIEYIDDRLKRH